MSGPLDDEWSFSKSGVPPTLDLVQHFRELRGVVVPALVIAVLCAAAVFAWRAQVPDRWSATVMAQTNASTSTTSSPDTTSASLLTAPYVAVGGDLTVLQGITSAAGVPWSPDEAQSRITVTDGQTPGLLSVQVLGDSAGQAAAVAKQAVPALDRAARTRASDATAAPIQQMQAMANVLNDELLALPVTDTKRAALQAQYQAELDKISQLQGAVGSRLSALADPVTSAGPVSPHPFRDAALALLAALIVAAEAMVGLRGRRGHDVSRSWSVRTARKYNAAFVDCTRGSDSPAAARVETLILRRLRAGADVVALYCPPLDATVLRAVGAAANSDKASGAPTGTLTPLSGDEGWWRSQALETARLGVVVVGSGGDTRQAVRRRLLALADARVPAVLMLLGDNWVSAGSAEDVVAEDSAETLAQEATHAEEADRTVSAATTEGRHVAEPVAVELAGFESLVANRRQSASETGPDSE